MPISPEVGKSRPAQHLLVEGVSAGYDSDLVIRDVSVSVGLGEVVVVVGPNGSGKSTLLKSVIGQIAVRGGRVVLGTEDVTNMRTEVLIRRKVSYVPQEDDIFPPLTVLENLQVGGYHLSRVQRELQIASLLDRFPALAQRQNAPAALLSGGEAKILAVARALMSAPSLVILDEPTSQLSPAMTTQILSEGVRGLADAGQSVLVVEQKVLQALAIADWVCVLVAGRVVATGPPNRFSQDRLAQLFLGGTL